jgi:hypothetical protein
MTDSPWIITVYGVYGCAGEEEEEEGMTVCRSAGGGRNAVMPSSLIILTHDCD